MKGCLCYICDSELLFIADTVHVWRIHRPALCLFLWLRSKSKAKSTSKLRTESMRYRPVRALSPVFGVSGSEESSSGGITGFSESELLSQGSDEDSDEDSEEDSDEDSEEDSDEDSEEDSDEDSDDDSEEDSDEDSEELSEEDSSFGVWLLVKTKPPSASPDKDVVYPETGSSDTVYTITRPSFFCGSCAKVKLHSLAADSSAWLISSPSAYRRTVTPSGREPS